MKWVSLSPVRILNENSNSSMAPCSFTHDIPAVVFSSSGFIGNQFHEINEIIIPLFITTCHFRSCLKFVITDFKPWWVSKYRKILKHLSRYEVINPAVNGSVHCFPGAVVGLKNHDYLAFNMSDILGGYSMFDFRNFLRQSYNLKIKNVKFNKSEKKPVLMLLSRQNSRRMLSLDKFTEEVNKCNVMVGVHGAGLMNEVFLPDGAVVVQVVPLGLDWAASNYFGAPAIITDPASVISKGYYAFRDVYLDEQNVKINVGSFRETLVRAMKNLSIEDDDDRVFRIR
ncbi:hypothetical protein Q3G72_029604 [Acer saccharum]|nr:hypothetical protein Q3G72_029604 [Acer saccharum]